MRRLELAMRSGHWEDGVTIGLGILGSEWVVNGSHSLTAAINVGKEMVWKVTSGYTRKEAKLLDDGIRCRSVPDHFGMGHYSNATQRGAVCSFLEQWERRLSLGLTWVNTPLPSWEAASIHRKHLPNMEGAMEAYTHSSQALPGMSRQVVGGMYCILAEVAKGDADRFYGSLLYLKHMGDPARDSLINMLRTRFSHKKGVYNGVEKRRQAALLIKAWNLWRKSIAPAKLVWAMDDNWPMPE